MSFAGLYFSDDVVSAYEYVTTSTVDVSKHFKVGLTA
jgi:hypothetical protein